MKLSEHDFWDLMDFQDFSRRKRSLKNAREMGYKSHFNLLRHSERSRGNLWGLVSELGFIGLKDYQDFKSELNKKLNARIK